MRRLSYRFYRAVTSLRHWIERRFTRAGLLVLVSALITGVIGMDMDNTVAYQANAWLVALLSVSMMGALFFRARFQVGRTLPRYGSVGQPLVYRVQVRNRTRKILRDLELLEDLADPRPTLAEFIAEQKASAGKGFLARRRVRPTRPAQVNFSPLPALASNGETEATLEIIPRKRGMLRFDGVTVGCRDPFGLFRGFVRVPLPQTVIILPKRYPLPPIALPGASQYQQGGVAMASSIGESEEFVSLRDYRPGDPLRRVHWRSWARTGRLIVKEHQDEFFVRHALVLDTFARPERAEELEEAISVAASFACTIATQESLLDLMFIGPQAVCFTTGRGVAHAEQALEVLSAVQPCLEKPFRALHDLVLQHTAAVSGCICILIDWDDARRELVRRIAMTGVPVLTLLVATTENAVKLKTAPGLAQLANLRILEVGKVAQGLLTLEQFSAAAA